MAKYIIEMAGFTKHEINKFTLTMQHKLLQNAHKGDLWKTCDMKQLMSKFHEEVAEAVLAKDPISFRNELVDVANICLMLFLRAEMDV